MKKALIIQTAFIGDAILSTALLPSLTDLGYSCDVLVRKGNGVFFDGHPLVNKLLIWEKDDFKTKYKSLFSLKKQIKKNKYTLVINLQRYAATGYLTAFSGAKYRLGFSNNPFSAMFSHKTPHSVKENYHETKRNVDLLKLAHPEAKLHKPILHLSENELASVAQYKSKPYICIYPGSVWFTKRLSVDKWKSLISKIPLGIPVYFMGAPNEKELCNTIMDADNAMHKNLCGELSIMQSAALGKDALMNYCNDSSPVHFLSAVNAKISAFFLSTSSIFGFYPISDVSYIQEVKNLDCKPCGMVGKKECPLGHFKCNEQLIPETKLI